MAKMKKLKGVKEANTQTPGAAYEKGVKARKKGVHPTQNPYPEEELFRSWLRGWTDTDNAMASEDLKGTLADPSHPHSLLNPRNLIMGGKHGQFN